MFLLEDWFINLDVGFNYILFIKWKMIIIKKLKIINIMISYKHSTDSLFLTAPSPST